MYNRPAQQTPEDSNTVATARLDVYCHVCNKHRLLHRQTLLNRITWKPLFCSSCSLSRKASKWLCKCNTPWHSCSFHRPLGVQIHQDGLAKSKQAAGTRRKPACTVDLGVLGQPANKRPRPSFARKRKAQASNLTDRHSVVKLKRASPAMPAQAAAAPAAPAGPGLTSSSAPAAACPGTCPAPSAVPKPDDPMASLRGGKLLSGEQGPAHKVSSPNSLPSLVSQDSQAHSVTFDLSKGSSSNGFPRGPECDPSTPAFSAPSQNPSHTAKGKRKGMSESSRPACKAKANSTNKRAPPRPAVISERLQAYVARGDITTNAAQGVCVSREPRHKHPRLVYNADCSRGMESRQPNQTNQEPSLEPLRGGVTRSCDNGYS